MAQEILQPWRHRARANFGVEQIDEQPMKCVLPRLAIEAQHSAAKRLGQRATRVEHLRHVGDEPLRLARLVFCPESTSTPPLSRGGGALRGAAFESLGMHTFGGKRVRVL